MQSIPCEVGTESKGVRGSYGNEERHSLGCSKVAHWGLAAAWGGGRTERHFVVKDKPLVTSTWSFAFSVLIRTELR